MHHDLAHHRGAVHTLEAVDVDAAHAGAEGTRNARECRAAPDDHYWLPFSFAHAAMVAENELRAAYARVAERLPAGTLVK